MADNVVITAGTGTTVHADEYTHGTLGSGKTQLVKLVDGTLDSGTPVGVADIGVKANAIRICPANDITDGTYVGDIKFGEALPAGTALLGKVSIDQVTANANEVVIKSGTVTTVTNVTSLDKSVYVDDADWTDNTSSHTLVGGVYQSTPHTVTDGDVSPFQLDANGCIILGTSAKAIGKLAANTGVDIGDVDVTSIIPGVGATNLGKARDAAIGANDVGVMALAVRDDTLTTLTPADGDYVPLRVGSTGKLHVTDSNITACNTGAVVIASGTITTVSTVTNLSQLGGTAISMGEGTVDGGCQRVTLATDDDGVAHLATIAGDTTNIETAIQIIDDWDATQGSAVSADGPQIMAAYDSTKPTVVTDGQAVRILADAYGRLLAGVEPTAWHATYDSADASGAGEVVKASAASTILVIQSYIISSDVEGWAMLVDEDDTQLTGKFWLKAGGGVAITLPDKAPIIMGVDKDLEIIVEGAGNVSVSATGYTIPG